MSSDETRPILCSTCNVPAEAVVKADTTRRIRCPGCGYEDDFHEAVKAALGYQARQILDAALSGLSSSSISVKGSSEPKPRFIFG